MDFRTYNKTDFFRRTINLLNRYSKNVFKIPENDLISWLNSQTKNEVIQNVFEFEFLRYKAILSLPDINIYTKNRLQSISFFEEVCKKDEVMELFYKFNPDTKLITASVDVDLDCFELSTLNLQKENYFYFLRRSITHQSKLFENKIEGWNKLLVDIYYTSSPIKGEDLFLEIKRTNDNIRRDEVAKFISNNVVYYDTLKAVK